MRDLPYQLMKKKKLLRPLVLAPVVMLWTFFALASTESEPATTVPLEDHPSNLSSSFPYEKGLRNMDVAIGVTGRVTSSEEVGGVPGVNILVKGTTTGTVTDIEGSYSIEVPNENDILVFSSIGYVTQEIPVNGRTVIDVVLAEDTQSLDEVVVTGYSTQRQKDITGSVSVVDMEKLREVPASNFGQQLQGRAAGVTVGTQGAPGSSTMIRIRGVGTVNNNGPLYVIDGVSTRSQDLNSINPNDIESMQVLKDASSASIYGAQASNGVIIITTKKGKMGKPVVSYDAYYSLSKAPAFVEVLNSRDRVNLEWESKRNASSIRGTSILPSHPQFGTGESPVFPKYIIPTGSNGPFTPEDWRENNRIAEFSEGTDWYDALTQTAPTQSHQVTLSGANETAQYLLSLGYFNQEGTYKHSYYKRYTMRSNTQFNVTKWLRAGENFTLSFSNANRSVGQGEGDPMVTSLKIAPWVPLYDITGRFAGTKAAGSGNEVNPLARLYRNKDNYNTDLRVFGNLFAEADISPDLRLRTSFGLDHRRSHYYSMSKMYPEAAEGATRNSFSEGANYNFRYVWTNTLNYEKFFNEVHNFQASIGSEFIGDGIGRSMSAIRYDYIFEDNTDTWTLGNGGTKDMSNNSSYNNEVAMFGLFARADYAYDDRYLLTGIIRRDGSSRFSPSNRYGVFPSISAGWRISEENFLKNNLPWANDLKFRAGYGVTGNSEIPRASNWATEYGTNPGATNYDFTGAQNNAFTGFMLTRFSNPNTKWETTKMLNVGFDATLFNGLLEANIEYYVKKTSDMLVRDTYSALAGKGEVPFVNLGNIENKGWDIALNHNNTVGEVNYNIGVNLSTYKNKIIKLNNIEGSRFWGGGTRFGDVSLTEEGQPIAQFFGYNIIGFYDNEEEVMDYLGTQGDRAGMPVLPLGIGSDAGLTARNWVGKYMFEDINGDGRINAEDKTVIGNPHPDFTGGLNLGISFRNFDLSSFFYASVGNEIFNYVKWFTHFESFAGSRSPAMRDDSWRPGKTDATLPILDAQDNVSGTVAHSYYIEDGSYLRLQTLSVGYQFPQEVIGKIGLGKLRLYVQGTNLLTWTGYTGVDPEITNQDLGDGGDLTRGVDFGRWPQPKQFLVGINASF
jgi:TonB-linked SusC/RagA family outer membrane protein